MIQTRNITPSLIEIYTDGGGYITESYPTYFHTFATARPLAAGETVADFREVTAAERQRLEEADAAFVRPPQLFIDEWNAACVYTVHYATHLNNRRKAGQYNGATGYFELNGLKDITYEQALIIMADPPKFEYGEPSGRRAYICSLCRTHLPFNQRMNMNLSFYEPFMTSLLEVVYMPTVTVKTLRGNNILRDLRVYDVDDLSGLPALEEFRYIDGLIVRPRHGLSFAKAAKLSHPSLRDVIRGTPDGDKEVAITVHPDVYARLTDETNEEWHALIDAAAAKNIVFATP